MKIISILAALALTVSAFSQDPVRSKWRSKSITVDGVPAEYNNPLRLYSNETNLFFEIINDSANLYLCFEARDENAELKINQAGMRVELKAKSKKLRCDASINFPLAGRKEQILDESKPGLKVKPDISKMKNGFLLQNIELLAQGFVTQNGTIPIKDSTSGIKAAINWDAQNTMTYELAIPLRELFGAGFDLKDLTKPISLKVYINAFTRPASHDADNSASSGSGGMGSGGRSGGGMGGMGGMGGGMGGRGGRGGGGGNKSQSSGPKEAMFEADYMRQPFFIATGHP